MRCFRDRLVPERKGSCRRHTMIDKDAAIELAAKYLAQQFVETARKGAVSISGEWSGHGLFAKQRPCLDAGRAVKSRECGRGSGTTDLATLGCSDLRRVCWRVGVGVDLSWPTNSAG